MEYRCITVPESGIARGEVVECEAYDLVGGKIVKTDCKLPVFGAIECGKAGRMAMVVQLHPDFPRVINSAISPFDAAVAPKGCWFVVWEDC